MPYADGTTVSIDRSMTELAGLLRKHGATGFAFGADEEQRMTRAQFKLAGRVYRLDVAMPDPAGFYKMRNGQRRTESQARAAAEKEDQRRWRSLVLVVKAILVAIADGVLRAEDALLAFTVLPDGATMSTWAEPQLEAALTKHTMPGLLPGAGPTPLEGRST